MIQLSALPTVPGTASMAEFLGNGGADAGESTNFGVLLAVRIGTETVLSAPATAAIPAPALPDTGKILPPALPGAVLPLATALPDTRSDAALDSGTEDNAAERTPLTEAEASMMVAPVQIGPVPQDVALVELAPLTPAPLASTPQSPVQPGPALAALAINAPISPLVHSVLSRTASSEAARRPITPRTAQPSDQPPVQSRPAISPAPVAPAQLSAPALPVLPIAFAAALPLAPAELERTAEPPTRAPTTLRLRAASAVSAAQSGTAAPIMLAGEPGDVPPLVFKPLRDQAALLREVPVPREGAASPLGGVPAAEPASTTPAMAPVRPLDFAALVDRLVMARDAAAPQTVSLALTHAEFGKISLRFEQDDTGLSVGMTSPDPDFARAVSAAMPPERTSSAEQHQGGQSSRHDASGSDLPGQSRGGSNPERRDERGAPRPDPAQTTRHRADKQGRGEIFA